jgi:hypothetical protein
MLGSNQANARFELHAKTSFRVQGSGLRDQNIQIDSQGQLPGSNFMQSQSSESRVQCLRFWSIAWLRLKSRMPQTPLSLLPIDATLE